MVTFSILPALVLVGFVILVLYKHFIKKEKQDLKTSAFFALFYVGIWAALYYFVFG